jgi:hypothetical protein
MLTAVLGSSGSVESLVTESWKYNEASVSTKKNINSLATATFSRSTVFQETLSVAKIVPTSVDCILMEYVYGALAE